MDRSQTSTKLIETDIARTFPALELFQRNAPSADALTDVLLAYACYRPDVGYVQGTPASAVYPLGKELTEWVAGTVGLDGAGMSYIAGLLLIYMEPYLAFQCLANLLSAQFLRVQFRMEIDVIQRYFKGTRCWTPGPRAVPDHRLACASV